MPYPIIGARTSYFGKLLELLLNKLMWIFGNYLDYYSNKLKLMDTSLVSKQVCPKYTR
jgi:hypothetical protein